MLATQSTTVVVDRTSKDWKLAWKLFLQKAPGHLIIDHDLMFKDLAKGEYAFKNHITNRYIYIPIAPMSPARF